jgi:hypothetical protein
VRTVLSENNVKTSEIKIHKAICVHILKACILQNEIIFLNEKKIIMFPIIYSLQIKVYCHEKLLNKIILNKNTLLKCCKCNFQHISRVKKPTTIVQIFSKE